MYRAWGGRGRGLFTTPTPTLPPKNLESRVVGSAPPRAIHILPTPRMVVFVACLLASAASIDLATFDGSTSHTWHVENDPVMGGQSFSNFSVKSLPTGKKVGEWRGQCRIVPSLQAPGFTIAMTEAPALATFPNVADEEGLLISMRNVAGSVSMFKVAFCDTKVNPYRCQFGTFKTNFTCPQSDGFRTAFVPWSAFSDKWDPATGLPTGDEPPTRQSLASISQVQLWVEGVVGDFHVWIEGVRAGKISEEAVANREEEEI